MQPAPDFISTAEVADRLKVNVATINRWVTEKRLTPVFTGPGKKGARFFAPDDVARLTAEHRADLLARLPAAPSDEKAEVQG